jgi:hypothetical protein
MTKKTRWAVPVLGCVLLLTMLAPAGAQTKEKVYRALTPAQLETILTDMGLKFNKTQPKTQPNDYDYDFDRNNYKIRLTLSNGKLLWLSNFQPKNTLEKINQWNVQAKFSRAVLDRVGDREYAIVEYQLDAGGGVTDKMIRQFIKRFDKEVADFDAFLK